MNWFFAILLLASTLAQSLENGSLEPCSVCTLLVETLEEQFTTEITKAQMMEKLSLVSKTVCENVPSEIVSQQKCNSFVSLYGPYTIDLILSNVQPQEICSALKVCGDPTFEFLFPSIEENQLTYSASEKNFKAESEFKYKIFLGALQFLDDMSYGLSLKVNKIADCDISIKITNRTDYVETDSCSHNGECNIDISKPGMGVWYYITINAKSQSDTPSFTLELREENKNSNGHWVYKGGHQTGSFIIVLTVILLAMMVICVVITKCVFGRRLGHSKNKETNLENAQFLYQPQMDKLHNEAPMLVFMQDGMPYLVPQYIQLPSAISQE
jgi:hypothetical protein